MSLKSIAAAGMRRISTVRGRGLAPSLGAGGSLIAAALCCLVVFSALLAYRNWPDSEPERREGTLSLRPPEGKVAGRVASGPVAASTTARVDDDDAVPRDRGGVAGARSDRAPRRSRPAPRAPGRSTPRATVPVGGAPLAPDAPAPARAPAAGDGGGNGGGTTGGGVGGPTRPAGPVEQIVSTGRDAVGQVTAPLPVPSVVGQPVDGALDTVEDAGRTVDGVTGALLP